MTALSPFVDAACCADLYGDADRLARRTGALHRAKIAGPPVAEVIVDLAVEHLRNRSVRVVADIGCGRGTTTLALADRLHQARLVAVDLSPVVLASARARLKQDVIDRVCWMRADFHHLGRAQPAVRRTGQAKPAAAPLCRSVVGSTAARCRSLPASAGLTVFSTSPVFPAQTLPPTAEDDPPCVS